MGSCSLHSDGSTEVGRHFVFGLFACEGISFYSFSIGFLLKCAGVNDGQLYSIV